MRIITLGNHRDGLNYSPLLCSCTNVKVIHDQNIKHKLNADFVDLDNAE